ncbi:MAG TPA: hypothetical protein VGP88_06010 [Thermoplasmata archaeon]|nr:hypothetical protein [Thermoplasmata archaeon]
MTAGQAWFVTVALVVGALIVFFFLGWNLAGAIGSALHGVEHFLGHPLTLLAGSVSARAPPT